MFFHCLLLLREYTRKCSVRYWKHKSFIRLLKPKQWVVNFFVYLNVQSCLNFVLITKWLPTIPFDLIQLTISIKNVYALDSLYIFKSLSILKRYGIKLNLCSLKWWGNKTFGIKITLCSLKWWETRVKMHIDREKYTP